MQNYKMILQYDGTNFSGWQKQGNTENTVQGLLEKCLSGAAGCSIEVNGAGRTDAGVHALGQCASFRFPEKMNQDELLCFLRSALPESVGVLSLEQAPERFHARLWATGKTYVYRIRSSPEPNVFTRRFVAEYEGKLDPDAMRSAAGMLLGSHDFAAFCGNRHMKKSTVRRLDRIDIREEEGEIRFSYSGDGFLMYMVRIMTGTLLEIGKGKMPPQSIEDILASGKRELAGPTAPAKGLCLKEVYYPENPDFASVS